jgi:hypothetical protein
MPVAVVLLGGAATEAELLKPKRTPTTAIGMSAAGKQIFNLLFTIEFLF